MKAPNLAGLEEKTFLLLVVVISLAFAWILWPFFGAVLRGTILSIEPYLEHEDGMLRETAAWALARIAERSAA